MKKILKGYVKRLVLFSKNVLIKNLRYSDIRDIARTQIFEKYNSAIKEIEFYKKELHHSEAFDSKEDLWDYTLELIPKDGICLEFGVFEGRSINYFSKRISNNFYGFDSFEGLPETWNNLPIGKFKVQNLPKVNNNVTLIEGYFDKTLSNFLKSLTEKISFLHLDADLYSSTKYVLETIENKLSKTTIILFDELIGYPNWHKDGEYKAISEFINEYN